MDEIEVKIIDINKQEVIRTLEKLKAVKVFEGKMQSSHFDREGKLKHRGELLRLRKKGEVQLLTFKRKKEAKDVKICDEYETEISDAHAARQILGALGYEEVKTDIRNRTSYRIKNSLVEIDEYPKIPAFLEVESPTREELKNIVHLLGYTEQQMKPWTRGQLLAHYRA